MAQERASGLLSDHDVVQVKVELLLQPVHAVVFVRRTASLNQVEYVALLSVRRDDFEPAQRSRDPYVAILVVIRHEEPSVTDALGEHRGLVLIELSEIALSVRDEPLDDAVAGAPRDDEDLRVRSHQPSPAIIAPLVYSRLLEPCPEPYVQPLRR